MADILDACGYSMVIIETVGTGQNQVDIMQAAHTVIAVSAPGLGDDIQAMKSGLLEIADIHAVTKNDFSGSDQTLMEIGNAVHMRQTHHDQRDSGKSWSPPVLSLNGLSGDGMIDLQQAIAAHHAYLMKDKNLQKRCRHMFQQRIFREAVDILSQSFAGVPDACLGESLEQVIKRDLTPTEAAIKALNTLK